MFKTGENGYFKIHSAKKSQEKSYQIHHTGQDKQYIFQQKSQEFHFPEMSMSPAIKALTTDQASILIFVKNCVKLWLGDNVKIMNNLMTMTQWKIAGM